MPNSPLVLARDQPFRAKAMAEELLRVTVKVEVVPTAALGKLAGLGVMVSAPVIAVPVSEAVASATVRVAVLLPTVVAVLLLDGPHRQCEDVALLARHEGAGGARGHRSAATV